MRSLIFAFFVFGVRGLSWQEAPAGLESVGDLKSRMNEFALELHKTASEHQDGNLVSSPLSAYMVLAMASFGARNITLQEFQEVLHLPEEIFADYSSSSNIFQEFNSDLEKLEAVLSVGNKIFANSDISLMPSYEDFINETFSSPVTQVNFTDSQTTAELINSWSEELTHGNIKDIVDSGEFDESTQLMLLNSVYFAAKWVFDFEPRMTEPYPFHVGGGLIKNVPMMFNEQSFRFGHLDQMDADFVVLPYEYDRRNGDKATYMYLISPRKPNGLAEIEENLGTIKLEEFHNVEKVMTQLIVPKFNIENTLNLEEHLQQLGLASAFSVVADFGGMTEESYGIFISKIAQKSVINLDEAGCRAAASTTIRMVPMSMPEPTKFYLTIDRPFFFIVGTEDLVLFSGKVVDPSV